MNNILVCELTKEEEKRLLSNLKSGTLPTIEIIKKLEATFIAKANMRAGCTSSEGW